MILDEEHDDRYQTTFLLLKELKADVWLALSDTPGAETESRQVLGVVSG